MRSAWFGKREFDRVAEKFGSDFHENRIISGTSDFIHHLLTCSEMGTSGGQFHIAADVRHNRGWVPPGIDEKNMFYVIYKSLKNMFRPPVRSNGRTYKMLVMFLFFPTRNLQDPSADHRETLPHDWKLVLFYNPTSKILGALPQKNLGAKNMQNFGVFFTTSHFDREYLRNGLRYPKSES